MKIRELQLYTNELDKTKAFYTTILAFELIDENENQFSLQIGWTKLTFVKSDEEHIYHFINVDEGCFAVMYINYGLSYLFYRFELSTDFVPGKSSIFVG